MPYTDVINTTGALFQAYSELVVNIGNNNGDAPQADLFEGVHCSRVVQSAGGQRLDFAELTHQLTSSLINRTQPSGSTRMVDVLLPATSHVKIHRGDYLVESIDISKDAESLMASSQLSPYHYGFAVTGYDVWNPLTVSEDQIDEDIIFNPTIDNETAFNRSSVLRGFSRVDPVTSLGYYWAHPELADSSIGQTFQAQTISEWTMTEAAKALCGLLNYDEAFIFNPTPTEFDKLIGAPELRDVRIPIGTRLNEALDILLIPLGYNHFINYSLAKPILKLFKIGDGPEKELKYQTPGTSLDLELSNVNQFNISNSSADTFNEVIALGEFEEVEVTIPIYPGWPSGQDDLSPADLAKDGQDYETATSAYRLFIANEAGDLDATVERFGVKPEVPDLTSVVTSWVPHRRTLGEPLTYLHGVDIYDDGSAGDAYDFEEQRPQRMPIVLEWSDDAGATWQREESTWTVKLCPDQIGVYFDMREIPTELYDALNDSYGMLRMRITGTVFSDWRVTGLAPKQAWAVNGRDIRQPLKVPEKFQHRWRQTSGAYASSLYLTGHDADERDDRAVIKVWAEKIRDQNHYAEVDAEYRLPGWHTEYEIGDLITKIAGREISLNMAPSNAPEARYAQIVERRFEIDETGGPSTVLIMDRGTS